MGAEKYFWVLTENIKKIIYIEIRPNQIEYNAKKIMIKNIF